MVKKITISVKPQIIPIDDFDRECDFSGDSAIDAELMIVRLREHAEVQLLLLRYMGYDYKETTKIMNLKSIGDYYVLWTKLREDVEKLRNSEL